jgi:hypothetical protein
MLFNLSLWFEHAYESQGPLYSNVTVTPQVFHRTINSSEPLDLAILPLITYLCLSLHLRFLKYSTLYHEQYFLRARQTMGSARNMTSTNRLIHLRAYGDADSHTSRKPPLSSRGALSGDCDGELTQAHMMLTSISHPAYFCILDRSLA